VGKETARTQSIGRYAAVEPMEGGKRERKDRGERETKRESGETPIKRKRDSGRGAKFALMDGELEKRGRRGEQG